MGKSKNKRRRSKSPWITVGYPEMWERVVILIEFEGQPQIHTQMFIGEEYWSYADNKILAWMRIPDYNHIINDKTN